MISFGSVGKRSLRKDDRLMVRERRLFQVGGGSPFAYFLPTLGLLSLDRVVLIRGSRELGIHLRRVGHTHKDVRVSPNRGTTQMETTHVTRAWWVGHSL
jgi:hypothetical protein